MVSSTGGEARAPERLFVGAGHLEHERCVPGGGGGTSVSVAADRYASEYFAAAPGACYFIVSRLPVISSTSRSASYTFRRASTIARESTATARFTPAS